MNNTTLPQESDSPLDSPGFMAYSILLTVIVLVAGAMMGITVVALAMAQSIPRPLRLFTSPLHFTSPREGRPTYVHTHLQDWRR